MGQLLKLIEIRRSSGILLIARRGTFPAVMLKASDDQRRDSTIRTLAQDKPAIMQLRAQWQNVFPARAPESFTPIELVRTVQRELGARSVEAVLLRTPKMPLSPADLANITSGAVNVGTNQRRLLIARKGGLPAEVLPYFSPAEAVAVLNQLRDNDETARQIDRQAGRLYPDGKAKLQGANLRRFLSQQISLGAMDAAVVTQAATAATLAARPDAETPVGKMGSLDRIGEALKRSTPYAVKAGGDAIKSAVDAFLQPESIAIMIAIAAGVALANTNPLTGAAVNTTLVLLAWANGGLKAVQGIAAFVLATVQAQGARTEAELEAAAKAYGEALGAMGPDLIMAIVGRFVPRKGGGGSRGTTSVTNTNAPRSSPTPTPRRQQPSSSKAPSPQPTPPKQSTKSGQSIALGSKEAVASKRVYAESFNSKEPLVIGRLEDTKAGSELGMRRLNDPDWTINVNDAWVQGGIDAKKPFYLGSNPTINNLRSGNPLYPKTVFMRELQQLKAAGYTRQGDYMIPPQ